MDEVIKESKSPVKLAQTNDVYVHLKVSHLSDIATNGGSQIHKWAIYGPPAHSKLK